MQVHKLLRPQWSSIAPFKSDDKFSCANGFAVKGERGYCSYCLGFPWIDQLVCWISEVIEETYSW